MTSTKRRSSHGGSTETPVLRDPRTPKLLLAFDYDINPNHRLTLQGIYNRRHDWENRYRVTYKDLDKTGLDDEGDMQQSAQIETKGGTPDNRNARLELQQTMDLSLSGEHQFGKLSVNWELPTPVPAKTVRTKDTSA